jgi:hypothetical protein
VKTQQKEQNKTWSDVHHFHNNLINLYKTVEQIITWIFEKVINKETIFFGNLFPMDEISQQN